MMDHWSIIGELVGWVNPKWKYSIQALNDISFPAMIPKQTLEKF